MAIFQSNILDKQASKRLSAMRDTKKIFFQIAWNVFALDIDDYFNKNGRSLYGIRFIEDEYTQVIDYCSLFGPENLDLITILKNRHQNCKAGYSVDAGNELNMPDLKADFLFISDSVLAANDRIFNGQLFHELCHLVIDAELEHEFLLTEEYKEEGKEIRQFTQYRQPGPGQNDKYHTEDWFALLFIASKKFSLKYSSIYKRHQDAVECALFYDRNPIEGINWL